MRKAEWFDARGTKHSQYGDPHSLSNKGAFRVYNVTRAYLEKCRSSKDHAKHMVYLLGLARHGADRENAENYRLTALDGAPYGNQCNTGMF